MKAAGAPQEHCETESEIETADRPEQWNGIRAAQTGTPRDDTWLGGLLQAGGYENRRGSHRPMAAQAYPYVYLEGVEASENTGKEPNQVWHQAVLGTYVG
jgi:hypothetical protein